MQKIVPQIANISLDVRPFFLSDDGSKVAFNGVDQATKITDFYVMNIDGSNVQKGPSFVWRGNYCWQNLVDEKDFKFRCNLNSDSSTTFFRTDDFSLFTISDIKDWDFTFVLRNQNMVGRVSNTELVEFDPRTGQRIRGVCNNGYRVYAYRRTLSGAVVLVRGSASGLGEVVLAEGANCLVKNRLPSNVIQVAKAEIRISNDGSKVALITNRNANYPPDQSIYYVDMGGRAPIKVDAPSRVNVQIYEAEWVLNGTALLYRGTEVLNREHVFLWTAPVYK